jgi:hypothetical protein
VLGSVVDFDGELSIDCVPDIGCSVTAVVAVALAVPTVPGRRPIDRREVVEIRDARDPGRRGEGFVGVETDCR